jgi:L-glyceraldehyde 3-phosphate reductase
MIDRYERMTYRRCGRSGLMLPLISLGLWQNFGTDQPVHQAAEILSAAFDRGITHFDLANNYGPPPGAAEEQLGRVLATALAAHRDELVITTKAGWSMWPGPYGDWGSRKYLLASLDQSLTRMGLDYVDIFYSHRFDPHTPLEETIGALDTAVRSGRALYAGISSYSAEQTREAARIARQLGTPLLVHQPSYSMLNRWIERDLLGVLREEGIGCVAFSPLAQGLLTGKYLNGPPPSGSRAAADGTFSRSMLSAENTDRVRALADIASQRGQSLAQMALAWTLRHEEVTTVLLGVSRLEQLDENLGALEHLTFTEDELTEIDRYAVDGGLNIWEPTRG